MAGRLSSGARMRRALGALVVTLMLASACSSPQDAASRVPAASASDESAAMTPTAAPTSSGPAPLWPDLSSLPAHDVHIEVSGQTRLLRFAATLANSGTGPLEMVPDQGGSCPSGQRYATQVVYVDTNADGRFTPGTDERDVLPDGGCMIDHPTHDHWHFDASARYVLTAASARTPIVAADKVSFCLRDSHPIAGPAGAETYGECDRDSVQGISVGWGDEYSSDLDGQALELPESLADGTYCLTLAADPDDLLRETDDGNNAATIGVRISGSVATATDAPPGCLAPEPPSGRP